MKAKIALILLAAILIIAAGPVVQGEQIEGGYRNGYRSQDTH